MSVPHSGTDFGGCPLQPKRGEFLQHMDLHAAKTSITELHLQLDGRPNTYVLPDPVITEETDINIAILVTSVDVPEHC